MMAQSNVKETKPDYKGVEDNFDDGASVPLSTCDGNKRSLFIGESLRMLSRWLWVGLWLWCRC
jgi:hypothetical protein